MGQKPRPTLQRGVSFQNFAEQYDIPSLEDYTQDELRASWYEADEYDKFLDQCEATVERMEKGKTLKDKKFSSTGLEHWTDKGTKKRQRNRVAAMSVVFQEQQAQQEDGTWDHDSIAELYQATTSSSSLVASSNGLINEREAKSFLNSSDDDLVSLMSISSHSRSATRSRLNWSLL